MSFKSLLFNKLSLKNLLEFLLWGDLTSNFAFTYFSNTAVEHYFFLFRCNISENLQNINFRISYEIFKCLSF